MTAPAQPKSIVRHEDWCPVMDKGQTPRMESYPYLTEDPVTGRNRPTHDITRCLDCGAAHYAPRS